MTTFASPTAVLEREHRTIEKVVAAAPKLAAALEAGHDVSADLLRGIVQFMRQYADKCHHGKEEALLFPLLVQKGVPASGCPIGALSHEHVKGRTIVTALAGAAENRSAGDSSTLPAIVAALRDIVGLYPGHIWKEDFLLFPMTQKVLADEEMRALGEEFAKADADFGPSEIARFELVAEDIAMQAEAVAGADS